MKTLLINGSPRPEGNTVALIRELKVHLEGEIIEISAFYSGSAPCVDCRGCWETAQCIVRDGMDVIYEDDFDNVVIATPVYYGTMPGAVLSLMSRMQPLACGYPFSEGAADPEAQKSCRHSDGGRKRQHQTLRHAHGSLLPYAERPGI